MRRWKIVGNGELYERCRSLLASAQGLAEGFDRPHGVISVKSARIVPAHELNALPHYNLHAAPLPEYGGCWCAYHAIRNGERTFGATFHRMVPELDAGPIVASVRWAFRAGITHQELWKEANVWAYHLFVSCLTMLVSDVDIPEVPQSKSPTIYRRPNNSEGKTANHIPSISNANAHSSRVSAAKDG